MRARIVRGVPAAGVVSYRWTAFTNGKDRHRQATYAIALMDRRLMGMGGL
jgi:hypothetical protein